MMNIDRARQRRRAPHHTDQGVIAFLQLHRRYPSAADLASRRHRQLTAEVSRQFFTGVRAF